MSARTEWLEARNAWPVYEAHTDTDGNTDWALVLTTFGDPCVALRGNPRQITRLLRTALAEIEKATD